MISPSRIGNGWPLENRSSVSKFTHRSATRNPMSAHFIMVFGLFLEIIICTSAGPRNSLEVTHARHILLSSLRIELTLSAHMPAHFFPARQVLETSAQPYFSVACVSSPGVCFIADNGRCITDGNSNYGNNVNCSFNVLRTTTLSVTTFDLEYCSSCRCDYVLVSINPD